MTNNEPTFALDESIEEDKKKLMGEVEEDETQDEEAEDESEEEAEEGEKEPVKEEPKPTEPPKEPVDSAALARVRFENSELKRRLAEQQAPKEQPKTEDKIPDPTEDPIGYLAYENKKLKEQVESVSQWKEKQEQSKQQQEFYAAQVRGFNVAEEQFKATVPDYEEVSGHMLSEMKTAFKRLNPNLSNEQIGQAVANKIIEMAEAAAQRGEQPVGYLYNLSKTVYGYQPKPKEEPVDNTPKKPSLETIERNKKKSAHGLGGQGNKGQITVEDYAGMSISDMEKHSREFYETYRA